ILLDALSFVLAAGLLRGLPAMLPEGADGKRAAAKESEGRAATESEGRAATSTQVEGRGAGAGSSLGALVRSVPAEMRIAFRHSLERPALFRAVFAKAPVALAGGAGWLVLNLVADRSTAFGAGALTLGILQAVRGAGTGLGPLAVSSLRP